VSNLREEAKGTITKIHRKRREQARSQNFQVLNEVRK